MLTVLRTLNSNYKRVTDVARSLRVNYATMWNRKRTVSHTMPQPNTTTRMFLKTKTANYYANSTHASIWVRWPLSHCKNASSLDVIRGRLLTSRKQLAFFSSSLTRPRRNLVNLALYWIHLLSSSRFLQASWSIWCQRRSQSQWHLMAAQTPIVLETNSVMRHLRHDRDWMCFLWFVGLTLIQRPFRKDLTFYYTSPYHFMMVSQSRTLDNRGRGCFSDSDSFGAHRAQRLRANSDKKLTCWL